MNRDEIIRMARETGLDHREAAEEFYSPYCDGIYFGDLERFAALVAAAEREACAKVCESIDEADSRYRYDYKRGALACAVAIRSMS